MRWSTSGGYGVFKVRLDTSSELGGSGKCERERESGDDGWFWLLVKE